MDFFLATWNTPVITFGLKSWHPLPFFTEWYACKMICHTRRRIHFVRVDLFDVAKSPPFLKVRPVLLQLMFSWILNFSSNLLSSSIFSLFVHSIGVTHDQGLGEALDAAFLKKTEICRNSRFVLIRDSLSVVVTSAIILRRLSVTVL